MAWFILFGSTWVPGLKKEEDRRRMVIEERRRSKKEEISGNVKSGGMLAGPC